jgi:AcrR family transcriptional regulator
MLSQAMVEQQANSSREKILDIAEHLFLEKGFRGVRLKSVADRVGIKQASLYYHFPEGKRQLYVEVMRRSFARKRAGLQTEIGRAGDWWRDQLQGAAGWLLSQTLYDYRRMVRSDLPEIAQAEADMLAFEAYAALHQPLEEIFLRGAEQEGLLLPGPGMMSGAFIAIIDGIQTIPERSVSTSRFDLANAMIDVLVNGLRPRGGSDEPPRSSTRSPKTTL